MLNEINLTKPYRISMKRIITFSLVVIVISFTNIFPQGIGELAPPKPLEKFPPNAWGMDLMLSLIHI